MLSHGLHHLEPLSLPPHPLPMNAIQFLPVEVVLIFMEVEHPQGSDSHDILAHRYCDNIMQAEKSKSRQIDGDKADKGKPEQGKRDERVQAIKVAPRKVRTWFMQLSFWKKIIIIFTLNTLILLILTDTIMLVLFGKISDDIVAISNSEKDQFNQVANTQVVAAIAKNAVSKMDLYANLLNQMVNTYNYFSSNPQVYTDLETASPPLPHLTTSFTNASYHQPGMYYLNPTSTFTPLPYIDELLGKLIQTPSDIKNLKRVNVFVLRKGKGEDLTARTIPATDTFTIPSYSEILNRFSKINPGSYTVSLPYNDTLTISPTKDSLISLRTVLKTDDATTPDIFLEVELVQKELLTSLQNIYYFPSAMVLIVQKVDAAYRYYTPLPDSELGKIVNQYYPIGSSRINYRGEDYVTASVGVSNVYQLGKYSSVTNSTNDPVRCIILVRAAQTQRPALQIQSFLRNQTNILQGIIFCWSFIILLSTVALATVVGNYIFSNLKMLSTKMEEYIKDPSKFHLIVIELKQLQLKGILKKLSDNLIGIIEKIEVRKRERKDRINQNYHPLSVGEPKFQERQQLNDYQIIEEIKEEVRIKVEAMKKEAEEKEKAETGKVEKERADKQKIQRQKEREAKPAEPNCQKKGQ